MGRSRHALLGVLALGMVGGCEQGGGPSGLGDYRWEIVDGTREPRQPEVTFLYHDWGAGCTATVIAPRVAITAKHCVRGLPASGLHVYVGPSMYAREDEYRVRETRTTPGSTLDNADIAVLILDRDFTQGRKRWEFTRWPGMVGGALITAVGYGQTQFDNPDTAGFKYKRDGRVVTITGDYEFITHGENTCQGDSGGPILFQEVLVGVISRGEVGCTGYGTMTRVSGFYDLIRQALVDTGACVPTSFEVCNGIDDDCWESSDDALGPTCACSDGGAPRGPEACNGIDDDCNAAIDDLDGCACRDGAPPGTEVCNGIDDDCNGAIDEICARLGAACAADSDCASGLCADIGTGGRVCTAHCVAGSGAPCPDGGYCDAVACADGLCRPTGEGGGAPVGAACGNGGDCTTRFCAPNAAGGHVCSRPCTPGALDCLAGEACASIVDACGACLAADDVYPPRGFGEPCRADGDCLSGLCLTDGDPAACGDDCPYRYCAVSCGAGGACPDGSHCRDGLCVLGPASDPGDTCRTDADCVVGVCVPIAGGSARCVDVCAPDASCPAGFSCVDGACWPDVLLPGDPCGALEDPCEGGTCTDVGGRIVCVVPCAGVGDCTAGTSCVPLDDGTGICVPGFASGGGGGGGGCGCAAAGAPAPGAGVLGVLLAGLLSARLTRRRRSR